MRSKIAYAAPLSLFLTGLFIPYWPESKWREPDLARSP